MKRHLGLLNGSSAGLAAVIQVDTTVSFLSDRAMATSVVAAVQPEAGAFVWRKIFLRERGRRGQ